MTDYVPLPMHFHLLVFFPSSLAQLEILCCVYVTFVQVILVGALLSQFRAKDNKWVMDESGVRGTASALLAINKVNNKTDKVYDTLLPKTKVCCV